MKRNLKESGMLIIPDEIDKLTMRDDGLHAFVCPCCGNNVFDGKDIIYYDDREDMLYSRCWGGFGYIRWQWIPNKCTNCGTKFVAWISEKRPNGSVIARYIGIAVMIVIMFCLAAVAFTIDLCLLCLEPIGIVWLAALITNIDLNTYPEYNDVNEVIGQVDYPDDPC